MPYLNKSFINLRNRFFYETNGKEGNRWLNLIKIWHCSKLVFVNKRNRFRCFVNKRNRGHNLWKDPGGTLDQVQLLDALVMSVIIGNNLYNSSCLGLRKVDGRSKVFIDIYYVKSVTSDIQTQYQARSCTSLLNQDQLALAKKNCRAE